jgi:hypothetical protein
MHYVIDFIIKLYLILNQFDTCHLLGQLVVVAHVVTGVVVAPGASLAGSGCPGVVLHVCSGGDHDCIDSFNKRLQ